MPSRPGSACPVCRRRCRGTVVITPAAGSRPRCGWSTAKRLQARHQPQWPPITRATRPSWPRWLRPRPLPSPCPAAYTRVRSRGLPGPPSASRKRFSSAIATLSAKPMPTKAAGGDRVAAADQAHRLARRNDLAGVGGAATLPSDAFSCHGGSPCAAPGKRPDRVRRVITTTSATNEKTIYPERSSARARALRGRDRAVIATCRASSRRGRSPPGARPASPGVRAQGTASSPAQSLEQTVEMKRLRPA